MDKIVNHYYKHIVGKDGKPLIFMSGLPLPISADGKVHDVWFVDCDFHPCCDPDTHPELFVNCRFDDRPYGETGVGSRSSEGK